MKRLDISPVKFAEGKMLILDQTKLPSEEVYIEIKNKEDVWDAIYHLKVRGAPAIGVAAAYGLFLSAGAKKDDTPESFCRRVQEIAEYLNTARPTAVNLSWALNRMIARLESYYHTFKEIREQEPMRWISSAEAVLLEEAEAIRKEDEACMFCYGNLWSYTAATGYGYFNPLQCGDHCNRKIRYLFSADLFGRGEGVSF